mgnify:CR=1 FL=1
MKKYIVADMILVAMIAAVGYGLGFAIPSALGASLLFCLIVDLAAGYVMDSLGRKLIFSRFVQKNIIRKAAVAAAVVILFLIIGIVSEKIFEADLIYDMLDNLRYEFTSAGLVIVLKLAQYYLGRRSARKKYEGKAGGYSFSEKEIARMQKAACENREITKEAASGHGAGLLAKIRAAVCAKLHPAVTLASGTYRGTASLLDGVVSYKGIPYAKAPVGDLRWKAPEPPEPSNKVWEARYFGASPLQAKYSGNILEYHRQSEDCLTVNIWTASKQGEKKPVLVLVPDGDFSYGGSADPMMDMGRFVLLHPETVCVSFNSREGICGYADLTGLSGSEEYPDALSLGILDRIAALTWIRENIAAFGGDPDNVTLMGAGAGGVSVSLLSVCEKAAGLFTRAIVLSGSLETLGAGEELREGFRKKLSEVTGAKTVSDLLALSEEELKEVNSRMSDTLLPPVSDGKLFPADLHKAFKEGKSGRIEFVFGFTEDEADVYGSVIGAESMDACYEYMTAKVLKSLTEPYAGNIRNYLDRQTEKTGRAEAVKRFTEQWMLKCGQLYLIHCIRQTGQKVKALYWGVNPLYKRLGSGGVNVMAAILDNTSAEMTYGMFTDPGVAETLGAMISKFASGEETELYNNEICGIHEILWEEVPKVLLATDRDVVCTEAGYRFTEAEEILTAAGLIADPFVKNAE